MQSQSGLVLNENNGLMASTERPALRSRNGSLAGDQFELQPVVITDEYSGRESC